MSLHQTHPGGEIYFCTVTCYRWLPLIEKANCYNSLYRWFDHLKNDGCKLLGYVIMPNHFHVLLFPTHTGTSINKLIGECKRFMAYDIAQSLKRTNNKSVLAILHDGVQENENRIGKLHQIFRPSFDARLCLDEKMIEQKLDYIHFNPVRGKWNLVDDYAYYEHSSAAYYERGVNNVYVTHYKALNEV